MEQVKLHDAHITAWASTFFRFPNRAVMPLNCEELTFCRERTQEMVRKGYHLAEGILKPAVRETTPIRQLPDEIVTFFTNFWDSAYNNPHHVTAAQVGVYSDMDNKPPPFDPNVIDVEARVVETPKELPAPKGEQDE